MGALASIIFILFFIINLRDSVLPIQGFGLAVKLYFDSNKVDDQSMPFSSSWS